MKKKDKIRKQLPSTYNMQKMANEELWNLLIKDPSNKKAAEILVDRVEKQMLNPELLPFYNDEKLEKKVIGSVFIALAEQAYKKYRNMPIVVSEWPRWTLFYYAKAKEYGISMIPYQPVIDLMKRENGEIIKKPLRRILQPSTGKSVIDLIKLFI